MRTTVDILQPLDEQLRQRASQLGISYREALNRVIAAGLSVLEPAMQPFVVEARNCGWRSGIDLNHLNRLADELEDEGRFQR